MFIPNKNVIAHLYAQEAPAQNEPLFRAFFQNSAEIIALVTAEGLCSYVSPSITRILGHASEEIVGRQVLLFIHPDDLATMQQVFEDILQSPRESLRAEYRLRHFDGSWRWFEGTGMNLLDEPGVEAIVVNFRDITDRKQSEDQLLFQADILRNVTESVIVTDLKGSIIYWNEEAQRVFGYTAEEMLGKTTSELYPVSDAVLLARDLESILAGKDYIGVWLGRRKDGTSVWVDIKTTRLRDSKGATHGFIGIAQDITSRKAAEEALRQSEENFRVLAASLPEIVWTARPEGSILYYNQHWYDYTGFEPGSNQPETWSAILHPDDLSHVLTRWEVARTTGEPFEAEYRLKRADGIYRWHLGRSIAIKEKDGIINKWFGTATDITDQKEAEQQKDEFISIASHELKTPVTTIKGLTQLLKRKLERLGATELVAILVTMEAQINRLTRLVNDLLDSSKIQAGKLDYVQEAVDLDALVHTIIETMQLSTTTHTISMHGASHASIKGDRDKLEQVFINLISNAIKYSPQATSVDIRLAISQDMVMVRVHDNGVGIPEEQQHKIFERFYRAQDSTHRAAPGLGMGLYIASEIVKRHGGKITVASEEGKGSTFTVCLPLES